MSNRYALLSVYDKTGISDFAKTLVKNGFKIISTGGTFEELKKNGIDVTPIEEVTGNPRDSFDGRMKTISFQIESGILFDRKNKSHVNQAEKLNIPQIDVVVCNLYPFEEKPGVETIDVGGPTMIRSAAKNHESVLVVVDPEDYKKIGKLMEDGKLDGTLRKELAGKAFYHLSLYDSLIGNYFSDDRFPKELTVPIRKVSDLRYGENPHQKGSFYIMPKTNSPLSRLKKLWGRDLSGTNIGDIYSGLETVRQFKEPSAAVIKHLSPCGIAIGKNAQEALDRAIKADPVSAFGGVIVLNREMDLATAKIVAAFKEESESNIDIVAVPSVSDDALDLLKKTRKSMGVYTFNEIPENRSENWDLKYFAGGILLQDFDDNIEESYKDWKVVTKVKPNKKQLEQMKFGIKCVKSVKSNSVLVVDKEIPMTRGIGSGQTSRVGATKIALEQAGEFNNSGILISDSFFPFDDSVNLAAHYGIAAILEQGGSVNDKLSIKAADKAGIAMVFSGRRSFRH
ncbi:bifunctional phosphoribosylaminoimidazolecarboxamide formyltransferase/IMP cyclohydrolase [Candidatus Daviesbacteria bacterium RIFCSPHIGHO2_02_FULL_36_13]|uniref:Bifunctional purine biosynthesis protein PurH n=1 Tax=Candidatus Daviesbacteria bacterium RIFCSPHIGHO2_02_FULL_36_13 TaxID=1797768 RepID=A0A1F5JS69_9BACT|nr:MAG: bifunctional phosphoribosylaminoimidazolecarboxamide formyltransferase/IMP cyclohydrolase [Candidatus Daviesbacteria bacterium RIFCSPHIGHO2_02_FULL_36_13]OGE43812.1 MAG: bifunctional phosphoribosylaminoimidazolecarboxamide formyltransferase/IMP cyclohydrolase [Candidatus Daviesbacteria bacterium RIFCSPLOWO2_01_FULL_36_8]